MPQEAAELLLKTLKNRETSSFYSQGFEKAVQLSMQALPDNLRKELKEDEPARKSVPGSIISVPVVNYEVNFSKLGTDHFISKF